MCRVDLYRLSETPGNAIATENIAIYKTILGLILSAIRLLEPAATAGNEMPFLIPDEDTSWMQISDTDDAAGCPQKSVGSAIDDSQST